MNEQVIPLSHFHIIEKYLRGKYNFRYNVVKSKVEYTITGKIEYQPMTDYVENSIHSELNKNGIKCSLGTLRSLLNSDFSPKHDPFRNYFRALPKWDRKEDFISQLADTVQVSAEERNLWRHFFKKWLVALVATTLLDSVVNHTVLVLAGKQGIGKTTWLLNLIPPALQSYVYSGSINPNNKDTMAYLAECILINLDELENLKTTEVGALKEVITKGVINFRRAYGHNNENYVRKASFCGSVNSQSFLNDLTGSRRWLCFNAQSIDHSRFGNLDKVYSQAVSLFNGGFQYWLNPKEIDFLSANNEKYQEVPKEKEILLSFFEPSMTKEDADFCYSASDISLFLKEKTGEYINFITMGRVLGTCGFRRVKHGGIYTWLLKERKVMGG